MSHKNKNFLIIGVIIIIVAIGSFFFFSQEKKFDTADYPNETIAMMEQKRIENPDDLDNLLALTLEYNKLDDEEKTEELYKELIEKKPGETVYYYNLGMQYYYQEKFDLAAEYLLKGQKINPKMYQFYLPLLDMYQDERTRHLIDIDYLISEFKRLDKELGEGQHLVDDYVANITYWARAEKLKGNDRDALELYKKMKELEIGDMNYIDSEIERLESKLNNTN